jgi:hypothetical protein
MFNRYPIDGGSNQPAILTSWGTGINLGRNLTIGPWIIIGEWTRPYFIPVVWLPWIPTAFLKTWVEVKRQVLCLLTDGRARLAIQQARTISLTCHC